MSKYLHINVNNKIAVYNKRDGEIVCGNSDYVLKFTFDEEWDGMEEKTARLIWNGMHKDIKFTGDECPVPILRSTEGLLVGVYAGDLSTTTKAVIPCRFSVLCDDVPLHPEEGKIYRDETVQARDEAVEARDEAVAARDEVAGMVATTEDFRDEAKEFRDEVQEMVGSAKTSIKLYEYSTVTNLIHGNTAIYKKTPDNIVGTADVRIYANIRRYSTQPDGMKLEDVPLRVDDIAYMHVSSDGFVKVLDCEISESSPAEVTITFCKEDDPEAIYTSGKYKIDVKYPTGNFGAPSREIVIADTSVLAGGGGKLYEHHIRAGKDDDTLLFKGFVRGQEEQNLYGGSLRFDLRLYRSTPDPITNIYELLEDGYITKASIDYFYVCGNGYDIALTPTGLYYDSENEQLHIHFYRMDDGAGGVYMDMGTLDIFYLSAVQIENSMTDTVKEV